MCCAATLWVNATTLLDSAGGGGRPAVRVATCLYLAESLARKLGFVISFKLDFNFEMYALVLWEGGKEFTVLDENQVHKGQCERGGKVQVLYGTKKYMGTVLLTSGK